MEWRDSLMIARPPNEFVIVSLVGLRAFCRVVEDQSHEYDLETLDPRHEED
jgi:hypothetical protein